jgi:hypothetical protein
VSRIAVVSEGRGPTFVLVHSPLLGPTSWLPVAQELERRGRAAVVRPLLGVAFMRRLRALATDRVLAPWSSWFGEDVMRELVPDERLRAALEREMPRLPLSYFEASVPTPEGWNGRPCAYLLLSPEPYGHSAAEARALGWPVLEIHGVQHLATATDAYAVTEALLDLELSLNGARAEH